jgi:hypothetical protein
MMTEPDISVADDEDCACGSPHPHLDEFIADNVDLHFEAMGQAEFWMSVTAADGRVWHINCGALNPQARGYATVEEIQP